jgi:hypothetical protein
MGPEYVQIYAEIADPGGCAVYGVGSRSLSYCDYEFESHRWHVYLLLVSAVCCQVEVSASG